MLQGVAPIMETFDKQSGSCLIVWPRQKLTRWQQHAVGFFFSHRLRMVKRITNNCPSLSSHYNSQEKGKRGEWVGVEIAENRTRLFSFTSQRFEPDNTLGYKWDGVNTNEYQPPSNLFCLQTGTSCDCMLIIVLCHLPLLGYLLHVLQ